MLTYPLDRPVKLSSSEAFWSSKPFFSFIVMDRPALERSGLVSFHAYPCDKHFSRKVALWV
jgi:hypothetical protein